MPVLHIGSKNYSSWSLRPWLALRWARIPFEERMVELAGDGYGRGRLPAVRAVSPSGKVPALELQPGDPGAPGTGAAVIWDSLAIIEWAAEVRPGALWPTDPWRRAIARSASAEMHSGFGAIRRDLSMNLRRRTVVVSWPDDTTNDLDRLFELLNGLLDRFGGPWLIGERSATDAMFAPVACRLRSYGVAAPAPVAAWMATLFADEAFRTWEAAAMHEAFTVPATDRLWT